MTAPPETPAGHPRGSELPGEVGAWNAVFCEDYHKQECEISPIAQICQFANQLTRSPDQQIDK
jgi:hypothetical protein